MNPAAGGRRNGYIAKATNDLFIGGAALQQPRHRAKAGRDGVPLPSASRQGHNPGTVGRVAPRPPPTRGAAETHPTPAVRYATAYSSFTRKPEIFIAEAKYDCASRGQSTRRTFIFMFYFGLFPVPPEDRILRVRRSSFAAGALSRQ